VWESQGRAEFDEMPHGVGHIVLLLFRERIPPVLEFVSKFDIPGHSYSMPFTE
jgi:hypothetical protein